MGSIYFITPRKVQIIGFRKDGDRKRWPQTSGLNAVISMIYWSLESDANTGTRSSFAIHADNCPVKNCFLLGQNKNQFVIGYFMWRVLTQRNTVIEYLMQLPSHSRCLIDSGFASIKSCTADLTVIVLSNYSKLLRIQLDLTPQKFQYFRFSKIDIESEALPDVIYTAGLSRDRQQYLFSIVKPYVRPAYKDITCPPAKIPILPVYIVTKIDIKKSEIDIKSEALPEVIYTAGLSRDRQQYLFSIVKPYVRPAYKDITCPPAV
ncbi:hypothetical protein KUTeg_000060 [Tegillarca granosa]|uniref:Uncharacterized protein n=1 Tax=Tegillarca granosa TaxID=220873 RepID=A0ABQ9FWF4_TEGGR|nr:hypothetical protein KUTeg_000060 [Tegillarca granosa]